MKKIRSIVISGLLISFLISGCSRPEIAGRKAGRMECKIEKLDKKIYHINKELETLNDKNDREKIKSLLKKRGKLEIKVQKLALKKERLEMKSLNFFEDENDFEEWREKYKNSYTSYIRENCPD